MVKFLVVRFSSIGDIILTTPVVRHLKKQVEGAEIHYLTKAAFVPLLENNPYVDRVHAFSDDLNHTVNSLKEIGFDYIIDLHHNARTERLKMKLKRMDFSVNKLNVQKWLYVNLNIDRLPDIHMVDRNLDTIRSFITERDQQGLDYFLPEGDIVDMQSLPRPFRSGYIAMAIGAQHQTKRLPPELLLNLCASLKHPLIILGDHHDQNEAEAIVKALPEKQILNKCGELSIHQSASLIQQSRLLITHDTGLMHIGAAFGKIILSIWGNTVPKFGMFPYMADPASVQFEVDGLRCRPCSKIGYQKCPRKHFKCMKEQDVAGISQAAERLFNATTGQ
jgi:ADP-heptose:LPS heptosyltransferase